MKYLFGQEGVDINKYYREVSKIASSSYNNKFLIPKDTEYTNINGWIVSIKLPEELPCDLVEYLRNILNKQKDAFYKLELYLAYKKTNTINYALLCTRKTTNPIEEKLCIVIVSDKNIIDLISINAKRIIRCENKCTYDCCQCHEYRSMEDIIPKYYYLTNHMLWAVYSCEKSIPIIISMNALRILYSIIKSYFMPICCTNDCLYGNNQIGLRAYPIAVNDNLTDYQISTNSSS